MTAFDNEFAAEFRDLLTQFGQQFTYTPDGGTPRTITGIVTTAPLALVGISANAPATAVTVRVLADPTDAEFGGIRAAAISIGKDRIAVPLTDGSADSDVAISQLLSDSAGVTSFLAY